jgi:hypothetical protein
MNQNIFDTGDTNDALTGLYLWLLFGFLSTMVNCDIQRLMIENQMFRHLCGVLAFFLLFTILNKNSRNHVSTIWQKTIYLYILFLMLIKSKWYFSIPILTLLIIDQSVKVHINYLNNINPSDTNINYYMKVRDALYKVIITLIIVGFVHYAYRQHAEFGPEFSWYKLIFSSKCNLNQ